VNVSTQDSLSWFIGREELGRELSRERLHRLLLEVMHGNLWKNPKPARYAWCNWLGKETDYDKLLARCAFCSRRFNGNCPTELGFLLDSSSKLRTTPTIHVVGYLPQQGSYCWHYNVISVDWNFPDLENTLSHEYIHYVLHKLFPKTNVSDKFDDIAEIVEDWEGY